MESSLHAALKRRLAGESGKPEVRFGGFRVDLITGGKIIEIETGPLVGVREKIRRLVQIHPVILVKPIAQSREVKWFDPAGRLVCRRRLPVNCSRLAFFDDLVYLTELFPHPNLILRLLFVSVEEHRLSPKYATARYRTARRSVLDVHLREVTEEVNLVSPQDLMKLLPGGLPSRFDAGTLARLWGLEVWQARKILYCLRRFGLSRQVGYRNRFRVYTLVDPQEPA